MVNYLGFRHASYFSFVAEQRRNETLIGSKLYLEGAVHDNTADLASVVTKNQGML